MKRRIRITEKKKTGAVHKIGKLAELDGAELGRLSNEAWEMRRTGELDSADERDDKRNGPGSGPVNGIDQRRNVTSAGVTNRRVLIAKSQCRPILVSWDRDGGLGRWAGGKVAGNGRETVRIAIDN
jgi:hypothetical protein